MGFFKKVFKGVGKVFKKIGRGIKKIAAKVGKVFGKFGILGQLALMFILPGVGAALTGWLGASQNVVLQGIGKVLTTAGKFAKTAGNVFKTATKAVTGFVKHIGGTVLNKMGFKVGEKSFATAFQNYTNEVVGSAKDILKPFAKNTPILELEPLQSPNPPAGHQPKFNLEGKHGLDPAPLHSPVEGAKLKLDASSLLDKPPVFEPLQSPKPSAERPPKFNLEGKHGLDIAPEPGSRFYRGQGDPAPLHSPVKGSKLSLEKILNSVQDSVDKKFQDTLNDPKKFSSNLVNNVKGAFKDAIQKFPETSVDTAFKTVTAHLLSGGAKEQESPSFGTPYLSAPGREYIDIRREGDMQLAQGQNYGYTGDKYFEGLSPQQALDTYNVYQQTFGRLV